MEGGGSGVLGCQDRHRRWGPAAAASATGVAPAATGAGTGRERRREWSQEGERSCGAEG